MRWMGWAYDDLMACPADLIPVIAGLMRDEQEALRKASRRR